MLPKPSKRPDITSDKHLVYEDRQLSFRAFSYITRINSIFKIRRELPQRLLLQSDILVP